MPAPQYNAAAQRILASAPHLASPLWGITLEHPLFAETHRIINRPVAMDLAHGATDPEPGTFTYAPAYFELTLPRIDGKGTQDATLALQNVDRVITDELERANGDPTTRISVTLRLFIESDPDAGSANVPLQLSFANVTANAQVVSGTAGRTDVLNRSFPREVYRIDRWPGLNR